MNLSKISLMLLPLILLVSCTGKRYGYMQRSTSTKVNRLPIASKDLSLIATQTATVFENPERISSGYSIEKPASELKTGNKIAAVSHPEPEKMYTPVNFVSAPGDSELVDIKAETEIAHKLGMTGYKLAITGLTTIWFYLGFLAFMIGLVFSGIAMYKIKNYDLKVRNMNLIRSGFFINLIGTILLLLLVAFFVALFILVL